MGSSAVTIVGENFDGPIVAKSSEPSRALERPVVPDRVRFPAVLGCATSAIEQRCTQVSCRYHLAHPDRDGRPLNATRDCALAVANEGPHTLEEIAQVLGLTRERVRQIEESAIAKLRGKAALRKLHDAIG
ncbi:MAG: sigma factor-like helix-turn-helix DNA-binding protein [Myxococcota bacterium]